jgi:NAD(P)-dependent dehydrogenase (short-subunit alcohol dehydrogenase family)
MEAPRGIGGLSPHAARGRVTALRVLGRGYEIAVNASHAERLRGTVGDCFTIRGQSALALDEPTHQLIQPLTAYCGIGAHDDVDSALEAILRRRPIILRGSRSADVVELARTIHEHSIRQGFPFTQVNIVPTDDAAIEALCTEAGCGTVFLDLTQPTQPSELPATFVRHLFSEHYHLGTLAVVSAAEDIRRCFGPGMDFFPFCTLGFRRTNWHRSMQDVTFT